MDLAVWIEAAHRLLKEDGRLLLIHRPDALNAILKACEGRFGPAELIPVFPKPGVAAIRLIVRATKGARAARSERPGIVLNDAFGKPSHAAEAILRGGEALDPA